MAKPTPWKDEYTLLCEKCGYVIEGLDTAGVCPECGKPIEESLPRKRDGTPWQRKTSVVSLIKTWWFMLFRPRRIFDEMDSIERDGMSLVAAGLIAGVAAVFLSIMCDQMFTSVGEGIGLVILMAFLGFIYWIIGYLYAWIAMARICRIAKMRGYRVSRDAAWAISGHASVGLMFPLITILAWMVLLWTVQLIDQISFINVKLYSDRIFGFIFMTVLASFPLGLVVFEVLCSLGMSRCKFRNRQGTTLGWFQSSDTPTANARKGASRTDMP